MLKAIALNCTLKPGSEASSTDAMIELVARHLRKHEVELVETIRIADHNVKPGVTSDEGEGDDWPGIRARILEAGGSVVWGGRCWRVTHSGTSMMLATSRSFGDRDFKRTWQAVAAAARGAARGAAAAGDLLCTWAREGALFVRWYERLAVARAALSRTWRPPGNSCGRRARWGRHWRHGLGS